MVKIKEELLDELMEKYRLVACDEVFTKKELSELKKAAKEFFKPWKGITEKRAYSYYRKHYYDSDIIKTSRKYYKEKASKYFYDMALSKTCLNAFLNNDLIKLEEEFDLETINKYICKILPHLDSRFEYVGEIEIINTVSLYEDKKFWTDKIHCCLDKKNEKKVHFNSDFGGYGLCMDVYDLKVFEEIKELTNVGG